MSANSYAGEVALGIDGVSCRMRLTLGALAEVEDAVGADGLIPLIERFEGGRVGARDVAEILAAGLRAGGWRGEASDVLAADIDGGPVAGARAAAELLARAFSVPGT